uniref:Uncharacterized protein n=1 Tax=viral metagenome TaxID=1070528 RepID=A0A6C0D115_9ZZZZ
MQKFELFLVILILSIVFICCVFFFYRLYEHQKHSQLLTTRLHRPVNDTTDPYLLYRYHHHPHDTFLSKYPDHVHEIRNNTKSMSIIITGLIRNHGKPIIHQLVTYWIPLWKNNFKNYSILLLENDSNDNTRHLLKSMETTYTPHVTILSFPYSTPNFHQHKVASMERTNMMAVLRNELLSHLYEMEGMNKINLLDESTVVLMMDPDLIGVMYEDSFLHGVYTLYRNPSFIGVGCNTITDDHRIFDTFPFVPIHDSFEWNTEKDKNKHDDYIQQRYSQMVVWERSKPLVMQSTFNGMMLYSFSRLMKQTNTRSFYYYYPMISNQEENSICEHTRFHLQFPEGSIAIDPLWIFQLKKNLF